MSPQRWAFTFFREGLKFRLGRLYETFWFSQSNIKWTMVFLYPGMLFYIRWKAEHKYRYRVYVADESVKPSTGRVIPILKKKFGDFFNGKLYHSELVTTVSDFKQQVYGEGRVPLGVRVGCHGRMFDDSDNLALAVRSFCRKDPMIVFWQDAADPLL